VFGLARCSQKEKDDLEAKLASDVMFEVAPLDFCQPGSIAMAWLITNSTISARMQSAQPLPGSTLISAGLMTSWPTASGHRASVRNRGNLDPDDRSWGRLGRCASLSPWALARTSKELEKL